MAHGVIIIIRWWWWWRWWWWFRNCHQRFSVCKPLLTICCTVCCRLKAIVRR